MSATTDNRQEAYEAMRGYADEASRVLAIVNDVATEQQVAEFASALGIEPEDVDSDAAREYLYESIALSLEVDNEAHEVRLIFCTGGPHFELRWTQHGYNANAVWFLALPWFGREEIHHVPAALVELAGWFAELVDNVGGVESLAGYDEDEWLGGPEEEEEDDNE